MPSEGKNKHFLSPLIIASSIALFIFLALAVQHHYPELPCPIKAQWLIDCPGCGGTRAAQSLIKGNLYTAFSYNPLITIGILAIAAYLIFSFIHKIRTGAHHRFPFSLPLCISGLVIILIFTIIRNL